MFQQLPVLNIYLLTSLFQHHRLGKNNFKKLYDPRQTHAVYGVTEGTMDQLKSELKNVGANKFRKVKANGHNLWILCFSVENVK